MNHLISIVGPTAIGKTEFAVKIAKQFNCEIISADSRQFYKEMSIGTAKPTEIEMKGIPHHLIDFLSVDEPYSVGKFEQDVLSLLEQLYSTNNVAIMTGGSGLYINAVHNGIDDIPSNELVRQEVISEYKKKGIKILQDELKNRDPAHYKLMDIDNPQRLIRAVEVCRLTGKPYSSFRTKPKLIRPFNIIKIGLFEEREIIYARINQRVDQMIEYGLVDEVKNLQTKMKLNALQTVGYRELFEFFEGKCSLEKAIDKIKINTRRFAKRQMTWFKKDTDIQWFNTSNQTDVVKFINDAL
ncbi:MAG: tRNA (adenosine(37)-N6)-dimethylallyltransferase MiaA [Crocinitomicaceae bacterium]|nr:tRNA (adenosine(37)-N6)-dimethylallyltransferase MiaA [Crocinitomicaceae bacterium]MBT5403030.1 tRNA (adenosine(37)-N6)-dimethylallyltransferase MiaA [Crocinitomicaceae bacterium]MBT6513937.1 tRNA (adenosine(37)-N6)-dimethylallyltransferase MiaA [Crocinitomicaceae bacterium]